MEEIDKEIFTTRYVSDIQREERFIKVVQFMNSKGCKCAEKDFIDFIEQNNIEYQYFEDIEDMFNYYDEDDYTCLAKEYTILFRYGGIYVIQ